MGFIDISPITVFIANIPRIWQKDKLDTQNNYHFCAVHYDIIVKSICKYTAVILRKYYY